MLKLLGFAVAAVTNAAALDVEATGRKPPLFIALDYYGEKSENYDADKLADLRATLSCIREGGSQADCAKQYDTKSLLEGQFLM